jgi:peptidoglycan/LPS O-acetylase OafA/YrhL
VLVLANGFDLTAIASIGSAVGLMIFLLVSAAAMRLRRETRTRAALVVAAMALTVLVLVLFAIDTLRNAPGTFAWIVVIGLLAVVLDRLWTHRRDRGPTPEPLAATALAE